MLLAGAAGALLGGCATARGTDPPARPANLVVVKVGSTAVGRPVPFGYIGLSLEYGAVPAYAGRDPSHIDPLFVRLLDNLDSPGGLVLRIGGDSTDWSWWPAPGLGHPRGTSYPLTARWAAIMKALATDAQARLILGINLEADDPAAAALEARELLARVGSNRVLALEIGNESEQYAIRWRRGRQGWFEGRPPTYGFSDYLSEFSRWRRALPAVALAGPAIGSVRWAPYLPQFMASEPTVTQVTVHRYPLNQCVSDPRSPAYPSLGHLLSAAASRGMVAGLGGYISLAHQRGLTFRVDELNSVTCQGRPGVSDAFASALWVVDGLFAMARAGVDAVNLHMWPGAWPNQLFTMGRGAGTWMAGVRPVYYGLLFFNRAAPPGSRLLPSQVSPARTIRAWATRAPDGRFRFVLINPNPKVARLVQVRPPVSAKYAQLQRLEAPSAAATRGVTLAGQGFGAVTTTGRLRGRFRAPVVFRRKGTYTVELPPASAAMLTVGGQGRSR